MLASDHGIIKWKGTILTIVTGRYAPMYHHADSKWNRTLASKVTRLAMHVSADTSVILCRSLVLRNGDILEPRSYAIYKTHVSGEQGHDMVGRVEEILVLRSHNQLLGVLLCQCAVDTESRPPYYLPHCTYQTDTHGQRQYLLVPFDVSTYQRSICLLSGWWTDLLMDRILFAWSIPSTIVPTTVVGSPRQLLLSKNAFRQIISKTKLLTKFAPVTDC